MYYSLRDIFGYSVVVCEWDGSIVCLWEVYNSLLEVLLVC